MRGLSLGFVNRPDLARVALVIPLVAIACLIPTGHLHADDEGITIHEAAARGDEDALFEILEDDPSALNKRDEAGDTPLHVAARALQAGAVFQLLNAGANADAKDHDGSTALHLALLNDGRGQAAAQNRLNVVQYILLQDASVKATDARGRTPMHIAAMMGRFNALDSLRTVGAALDAMDSLGRTPMHLAAQNGQLGVLNWLVRNKVSISVRDKQGFTPLLCAAERAEVGALNQLLELGASADDVTEDGRTALHLLAGADSDQPDFEKRAVVVAELLLKRGAKADAKDKSGATAAEMATAKKRPDLARQLRSADTK